MPRNANEKLLSADVDSKLRDEFYKQVENRGFIKKRAIAAALQLWLSLPREVQARALDGAFGNDVISDILNYILNNEITQIRKEILTQLEAAKAPSA